MQKDIIITGATGLVGKRLIKKVTKHYDKNRMLCLVRDLDDDFEKKGLKIIKRQKIDFIKIDLVKLKTLKNIPQNPKLVFHLAANTETLEKDHSVNDLGTKNLIKAIKPTAKTHFLYASTVTFLATRPDCSQPIKEDSPSYPSNEYSRTKLNAEKYLIKQSKSKNFRLTVLNLNTIYGQGVRPNSLFDAINKMVHNKNLLSRINWPGITSIVHVDDVADAFIKLSKLRKLKNKTQEQYLVYAENLRLADLYRLAYKHKRKKYKPIELPKIFWQFCSFNRRFIPYFEKILPQDIYNWIWRAGLIVDNAAYCESQKLNKRINWKPKLLADNLSSVYPPLSN